MGKESSEEEEQALREKIDSLEIPFYVHISWDDTIVPERHICEECGESEQEDEDYEEECGGWAIQSNMGHNEVASALSFLLFQMATGEMNLSSE